MKKILVIMILICCFTTSCGMYKNDEKPQWKETVETLKGKPNDLDSLVEHTTIKRTVLLDRDDILIETAAMPSAGSIMELVIENNTQKNLYFVVDDVVINGYCVPTDGFYTDNQVVSAGEQVINSLYLSYMEPYLTDIAHVSNIEFSISANEESSEGEMVEYLKDKILVTIDDKSESFDESGTIVYEEDELKIIVRDYIWYGSLTMGTVLYVINDSEQDLRLDGKLISVNGLIVPSTSYNTVVLAGTRVLSYVELDYGSLLHCGIGVIEGVDLVIEVTDKDTGRFIKDIIPVGITY